MSKEALIENQAEKKQINGKMQFKYFPEYACFIKDNYLIPYIQEQICISKEINLPILRFFAGMSDADLIAMSVESHREFLTCAEENNLSGHLERSLKIWIADGMGIIKRDEISAEDITLSGYYRKKALLKFLPAYTTDVSEAIEIIKEIDILTVESDTAAANVYIKLLRERINEQTFFTEKLSNSTPGLHYTFDLTTNSIKYANKNYQHFFGYTLPELQGMGAAIRKNVIHADDVALSSEKIEQCRHTAGEEMISWEYRLKAANGEYVWMRNYSSVFKRDHQGIPTELVGIILDISTEKEIANKLIRSESQLLEAQKQAQVGSFELDVETGQMEVTPQFREIYEQTDFVLSDLVAHVHPDDRDRINTNRDTSIENGSLYDNEYRYLVNGKEKIIRSCGTVSVKNGRKILSGTAQDITTQSKLLEKLLENEKLYKQAQAIGQIGNWTWNMNTKELNWSDEIYRIYELAPQSLKNSGDLNEYNHPDDNQLIYSSIKNTAKTGAPFDFNYRIILKSGKIKIVHAKGTREPAGGESAVIHGTLQDITEQKAAEKQLKDYRDFIEKITDITPSVIAAYNIHTGKYSFINDAVEKLLGYPAAKILEEGVAFMSSLIHPDDLPNMMEKNTLAIENANKKSSADDEQIIEFKYRMLTNKGRYRWFHTYGTVFERNDEGLVESVLNISVDITEQEVAEQALYQKNLQLQQSNTSLEEYAYVASHDLKEPLRKIATFSDRMLTSQYASLNDEGRIYLTKIIDASKRMQKMIGDLLSVSTVLGNNVFETCNLGAILEDALIPLEYKIEESNASIEADELPTVSVVRSQFGQLFQNLVNNSLKFARKGVPSHIKISHNFLNYKAAERYGLVKAKKYLQLQFEDNGIGFENEYAGKIFTIFQRLHGKDEYDGTGIGLSICKKIVENHGGVIFAEGVVNQRAIFTMIIPL